MRNAVIKVVPADPGPRSVSRRLGKDLAKAAESIRGRRREEWHQLVEFTDEPRAAYWDATRLKKKLGDKGYEFTASVANGVGRLYARVLSQT